MAERTPLMSEYEKFGASNKRFLQINKEFPAFENPALLLIYDFLSHNNWVVSF